MLPTQLTTSSFAGYPPQARALADEYLPVLRELPTVLLPILLRELIAYDWKLPAERRELEAQLGFLAGLDDAERGAALREFRELPLTPDLGRVDWVNQPWAFMEQLTAWLWSAQEMDRFRAAAEGFARAVQGSVREEQPLMPRMGVVVIGAGVERSAGPLFRKLRPHGLYLNRVKAEDGLAILLAEGGRRAAMGRAAAATGGSDAPFRHWYVDGGSGAGSAKLTEVSYARLEPARAVLLERIQRAIGSGGMGPEELRSLLARMRPSDLRMSEDGTDAVLNHFQLSLLTEGAGTQIFATTFVQWAARECVRRAQPETLIVRYAPRQQAQTMNLMLSGAKAVGTDAAGSLVDADMGAYYTWLNMRRLSGAEGLRFLVWFEGHGEAMAIGPGVAQGASSDSALRMGQVLALLQ